MATNIPIKPPVRRHYSYNIQFTVNDPITSIKHVNIDLYNSLDKKLITKQIASSSFQHTSGKTYSVRFMDELWYPKCKISLTGTSDGVSAYTSLTSFKNRILDPDPPQDTTAPTLSNISTTTLQTSATISWTTNEGAKSFIKYGENTNLSSQTSTTSSYVTSHRISILNLRPSTRYYYQIVSFDSKGNRRYSEQKSFTTKSVIIYPPCLGFGTQLLRENKTFVNIEDVRVGDKVLGLKIPKMHDADYSGWELFETDTNAGATLESVRVKHVEHGSYADYYQINNMLSITLEHPVWAKNTDGVWKWVQAKDLHEGMMMIDSKQNELEIHSFTHVKKPLQVVSLDVEDVDTYFAGQEGQMILVHNREVARKEPVDELDPR